MSGLNPSKIALAVALACCSAAVAQETTSSIRGVVTASAGTAVSGATVTIVHTPSGTTRTAMTGAGGTFSAPGLRPGGPYKVSVTAPSFQAASFDELFLSVGEPLSLPVTLATGQELEEIVVSGQAVALGAGPTTTFDRDRIEGVASVQRDIRDLVSRDPFASINPLNRGVSIAGMNNRTNRFAVDGVRFSDNFGLQQGGLPTTRGPVPLDAVEQLSVKIAPYDITEGDFQGGSINVVMRSGGNDFTGSAFYSYSSSDLTGDESRGTPIKLDFDSKDWGAFLSGPLIENRLFFALAYENLDQGDPATYGLAGAPTPIPGLTQTSLDAVSGIAQSVYAYDTLGLRDTLPETDEKVTGKLDWNINDYQRLSYTLIYQDTYQQSTATGSVSPAITPSLNYEAYATNEPEKVTSHVLQLNSDWTNDFSTELRLNQRESSKIPSSLGAAGFAQFQVCLDPVTTGSLTQCSQNGTPRLFFGTEQFSQADVVAQKQYGVELVGRYDLGNHALKAQAAFNALEITNVFVQSSLGTYYFDSVADLQARRANSLTWQYSITGDLADVAANFAYDQLTFGLQDSWNILPELNLTYGVRLDTYSMSDAPPVNAAFTSRYGFPNTYNIDGLNVVQPRVSLTWRAMERLRLRAGFGLFSGGSPDVFIGNSFSVAGVFGNSVTINRTATGCTPTSASAAVCAAALNAVTGTGLRDNSTLFNYLATNTGSLAAAPVNAMSRDFKLPSSWKATVSADYVADLGRPLGDDWNLGVDVYKSWVQDGIYYTDLRLTQVGTAPDGRPIYADTYTNTFNTDLLLANNGRGESTILVFRADKAWQSGVGLGISYTWQDINSFSDMSSTSALTGGTTANGTYGGSPAADANLPAYGTSGYEIRNSWKLNLDYQKAFFGDYKSRVTLGAEHRSGYPYSLTMNTGTGSTRSLFGTVNGSSTAWRYLLYVPNVSAIGADPLVSYANQAVYDSLRDYVLAKDLPQGQIIGKNSLRSPDYFRVNLHLEQELPAFVSGAKFKMVADIENLLNLIDDEYGSFRYFNPLSPVVGVTCATATTTSCAQYRYNSFSPPTATNEGRIGLWSVRLGFRLEF